MLTATLRNVDGSVMMTIPKSLLDGLGLAANTRVNLSIDHGRIIIESKTKPKYSLAQLLSQCDETIPMSGVDRTWEDIQPTGREI